MEDNFRQKLAIFLLDQASHGKRTTKAAIQRQLAGARGGRSLETVIELANEILVQVFGVKAVEMDDGSYFIASQVRGGTYTADDYKRTRPFSVVKYMALSMLVECINRSSMKRVDETQLKAAAAQSRIIEDIRTHYQVTLDQLIRQFIDAGYLSRHDDANEAPMIKFGPRIRAEDADVPAMDQLYDVMLQTFCDSRNDDGGAGDQNGEDENDDAMSED